MKRFQFILDWAGLYWGTNIIWVICLILCCYYLCRKRVVWGKIISLYAFIFCIIYFCPLTALVITRCFIDEFVYWRMFWILPVPLLLGFLVVELTDRVKRKWLKHLIVVLCLCIFMTSGTCIYGKNQFARATNVFKVPQKVIAVCQLMRENQDKGEMLKAVGDYDFMCYMRQYDAGIYQPYGRYEPGYELGSVIKQEMDKGEEADILTLADACQNCRTNFIIFKSSINKDNDFANANYFPIGRVEDYTIYKFGNYVPEKLS